MTVSCHLWKAEYSGDSFPLRSGMSSCMYVDVDVMSSFIVHRHHSMLLFIYISRFEAGTKFLATNMAPSTVDFSHPLRMRERTPAGRWNPLQTVECGCHEVHDQTCELGFTVVSLFTLVVCTPINSFISSVFYVGEGEIDRLPRLAQPWVTYPSQATGPLLPLGR